MLFLYCVLYALRLIFILGVINEDNNNNHNNYISNKHNNINKTLFKSAMKQKGNDDAMDLDIMRFDVQLQLTRFINLMACKIYDCTRQGIHNNMIIYYYTIHNSIL